MAAAATQLITPQEYLEFERASETRHEYVHGEIVAMSGGTITHDRICGNVFSELRHSVHGSTCEAFTANMRIQTTATHYCYADASVACGPPLVEDAEQDTLLNPVVVFEVLSKSTARYDRGLKFQRYKAIESLREYVLVSQNEPRVERFLRTNAGDWIVSVVVGLGAVLELEAVACQLELAAVYDRVEFRADPRSGR